MLRFFFSWFRPTRLLWPLACLLLAGAGWLSVNYDTLKRYLLERDRLESYRRLVDEQERTKSEMIGERAALQAGGFPAEKAIRERFIMVKPGEQIIFIEPSDAKGSPPVEPAPSPAVPAVPALPDTAE